MILFTAAVNLRKLAGKRHYVALLLFVFDQGLQCRCVMCPSHTVCIQKNLKMSS